MTENSIDSTDPSESNIFDVIVHNHETCEEAFNDLNISDPTGAVKRETRGDLVISFLITFLIAE